MPVEAVLIGTRGGGDMWSDVYADIMRAAWQENVTVYIYIQPGNIRDGKNRLQEAGANVFDLENPAKTVWLPFEVTSAWMRDYGPHFYFSNTSKALEGGTLGAIYDRPGDYYVAADFARKRVDLSYTKLNLEFEWGNFQTNGKGLCIISDRVPSEEWSEFDKAGCVDLAVVSALDGEPTGHVDLFMFWADPNTLVIGVYTEAQDPINHKIMLEVADSLRKKYGKKYGFAVELMPMPSNCPRVGLKVPESCPDTTDVKIYRSYTNLLHLNKKLLVPVYQESTTYQQQALKMLASVANGRYKNGIVPINSDVVIRMEGAVHCITKTVPKGIIKSHCPTYLDSAFGGVSILCDNHGKCLSNRCACDNGFKGESCSSPA
ncbi:Porphyromonas-type peptidyl-arginine deiminase [Balamuthia mandrillaris]